VSDDQEFDYVVVGAGSAGCVVAARLAESGRDRVALLESGGEDDSFWIRVPLGYGKLHDDPAYNWRYESEPEAELNGARGYQPRGRVVGGTGSINGNVYMRGKPRDYDDWARLGNTGWGFRDVLPFFKRGECNEMGPGEYHGAGGPLKVSNAPRHELCDAFIQAGVQAGFPANEDCNGERYEGFGYNQLTTWKGRRWSAADAYLRPVRRRGNLDVLTHAHATRIRFRDGRACDVEFRQGNQLRSARARREVILCAGAFNSPQLLQLSGVGPAGLLKSHGIPVQADLNGVGANLQDHFGTALTYECTRPITINDMVNNPVRRVLMGLEYLCLRRGLMTTNASFVGASVQTDPQDPASEVRLKLALWARSATGRLAPRMGLDPYSGFSVLNSLQYPASRGNVRIRGTDSTLAPEIRFNFFTSERDRKTLLESTRLVRRLMAMPAMVPYVKGERSPGAACVSDEDIIAFCRERGKSFHHAVGSCRMGVGEDAVVDPRLRVRGLGGLRVIDASVMPRLVGANPAATVMMIAEKGAAMVLEDGRQRA
jgi:choline dehydrogenase